MLSSRLGRSILLTLAFSTLTACAPEGLSSLDEPEGRAIEAVTGNTRLRLMGANISSGNNQSYDPGEGIRIFQGTHPDVVMIQEFNYGTNSAADIRSFVDTAFGPTFSYFREAGAQIPNGIISRYPIIASGEWDDTAVSNRDFAWARIDIPGPIDLWAVSVHLLTTSSANRSTEATQLVSLIKQNIPAGDYLVIGGDFNTSNRSEAAITTFSQVVVTSGPYPADKNNNSNTNASRGNPYDWVLADADLNAYKTPVTIGASTFTSGLVADTRVYAPIAEISPALAGDSGATNMQHMGVIRDFLIPGDPVGSPQLFLNEILANEPGSDTTGEFVEIVNGGSAAADLSGYTLWDSTAVRHTFAAGTTLGAGKSIVVFAGAAAIPAGINAVASSTGSLSLGNSGDSVILKDPSAATVDSVTYTSTLAATDGVSMNRSPDASPTGSFVLHTTLSASASSPGKRVDGSAF